MPVRPVLPLLVWTLFVWSSRIRNIWGDDDLSTTGQLIRTGIAVVFLSFAVVVGWGLWRRRGSAPSRRDRLVLGAFIVWTVGFWLVRGIGIIVDDHDAGFTVIHTILMVVSIAIAALAARALQAPAATGGPDRTPVTASP